MPSLLFELYANCDSPIEFKFAKHNLVKSTKSQINKKTKWAQNEVKEEWIWMNQWSIIK